MCVCVGSAHPRGPHHRGGPLTPCTTTTPPQVSTNTVTIRTMTEAPALHLPGPGLPAAMLSRICTGKGPRSQLLCPGTRLRVAVGCVLSV